MFQSLLDTRVEAVPRSYRSFGVAFGLHAMLFAVVILGSYLVVGTITPPNLVDTTFWVTLPPPEGGPGGSAVAVQRPKKPERATPRPEEFTQPVVIPETPTNDPVPPVEGPSVDVTGMEGLPGEGGLGPGGPGPGGPGEGGTGIGPGIGPPGGTGSQDDGPIFVDATVSKPELLVRVQPRYPETARLARIQGTVLVQAVISSTGEVESVEVLSSTHPIFDAAAKDAVRKWRYRPAMQNGRPIAVYFTVEVRFLLQ